MKPLFLISAASWDADLAPSSHSPYLFPSCRCRWGGNCREHHSTGHSHAKWSQHSLLLQKRSCLAGWASNSHIAIKVEREDKHSTVRGWHDYFSGYLIGMNSAIAVQPQSWHYFHCKYFQTLIGNTYISKTLFNNKLIVFGHKMSLKIFGLVSPDS